MRFKFIQLPIPGLAPATKKPLFVADSPKFPWLATKMADFVDAMRKKLALVHEIGPFRG